LAKFVVDGVISVIMNYMDLLSKIQMLLHGFLGLLNDGKNDIDTRVERAVVLAKAFDNHRFRLRNDLDSPEDIKHHENH